ncbi:DUF4179 domain-containing protein [Bacillus sp. FJAT-42376]|uniref:DUF4179 domain-containing protein n=1 Tax=Bacillus sp. FJAT-42376 TaxID=2014076 RepID=UPI000F50C6A2|nr:DUF4179 domain-containing protein [Bacillus sp. FJAT-42376]AZB41452.1 DUF4179 domain-containing protein [Bacillus sp. FJAT-42376]
MNESFNKKDYLSDQERQQLKFSTQDRNMVFEKIRKQEPLKERQPRFKKAMSYILTPVAVGLIALLVTVQTPIKDEVISAFPALGSLSSQYGSPELKNAVQKVKPQIINQSAEDKGIKITIKEVLYDGPRMSMYYTVDFTGKKYDRIQTNFTFTANGEDMRHKHLLGEDMMGMGMPKEAPKNLNFATIEFKQKMPEKINLEVKSKSVFVSNKNDKGFPKELMGKWAFSFPVEKKGTEYRYTPNIKAKKESEFTVKEVVFAPTGIQLSTLMSNWRGKYIDGAHTSYRLFDDKGKPYEMKNFEHTDHERKDGKINEKTISIFKPKQRIPEYIMIRTKKYYYPEPNKSVKKDITENLPLYMPQNKEGGITVTKVEPKKNEVWIHYEVKGNDPQMRKYFFNMVKEDKHETKWLDDQALNSADSGRTHIAKFKTSYSKDLQLVVSPPPVTLEEFEVKVPLKKEYLEKR